MEKVIRRWVKIIVGGIVLLVGIVLSPVPGPGGGPIMLAGLAILASEVPFVQRLFERFKALRARHYDTMTKTKRKMLLIGAALGYLVCTTAVWLIWKRMSSG